MERLEHEESLSSILTGAREVFILFMVMLIPILTEMTLT